MNKGFVRVAAACPRLNVADVDFNVDNIIRTVKELAPRGVEVVLFPEMSITAYTCADLFQQRALLDAAAAGLERVRRFSMTQPGVAIVVGLPRESAGVVYNSAAFIASGRVEFVDKTYLPNYGEFYEKRWFAPTASRPKILRFGGVSYCIEICEDLWAPIPPSSLLTLNGAEVVLNLSASNDLTGKYDYLLSLIRQQSARCLSAYVYAGAGFGESTTDLVYDGKAIVAENGVLLATRPRWDDCEHYVIADIDIEALRHDRIRSTTFADSVARYREDVTTVDFPVPDSSYHVPGDPIAYRRINPRPFVPSDPDAMERNCREIINIQVGGLARRLDFIRARRLVVGVSGGLDSTLALLVACRAFDRLGLPRTGIIGITMPGFGTTGRTHGNAVRLMEQLGVSLREISIVDAVRQHFADIGQDPEVHDVTYENCQARERTQILMDVANKEGAIVLGTGDLSELALGWATYNGDQMSMYGVNAGVPKTLVKYLVNWCAMAGNSARERETLLDILDTPISPELIPADENGDIAQKTEDLVGPYDLHDFFLYYTLRYGFTPERIALMAYKAFEGEFDRATVDRWLREFVRRFFQQQFKRSCMPDGPKVGSVCLSPRGDWRMPSDASSAVWMRSVADAAENLK